MNGNPIRWRFFLCFFLCFFSLPLRAREKPNPRQIPFQLWAKTKELSLKKQAWALLGNAQFKTPYFAIYGENLLVWMAKKKSPFPIKKIYGEKKISLLWPPHFLEGEVFFYDFQKDEGFLKNGRLHISPSSLPQVSKRLRALGLELPISTGAPTGPSLYLQAKKLHIKGLLKGPLQISAKKLQISTCNFDPPHYHFYASSAKIQGYGTKSQNQITLYNMAFVVKDTPIFYLPYFYWDTAWNPFVPTIKIGKSSQFGSFALLKWRLPQGGIPGRTSLSLDIYGDRGVAPGLLWQYGSRKSFWQKASSLSRPYDFYGQIDGYTLRDQQSEKKDRTGFVFEDRRRFWAKWMHRQRLPGQIQMTAEYQKYSDGGMQLEYNNRQAKEDKEIESYLYFQKNHSSLGATLTAKVRQNSFLEETEKLPQFQWRAFGLPILPLPGKTVYLDLQGEMGYLRHFNKDRMASDRTVGRLDQRGQISLPFSLFDLRLRPFVEGRFSGFSTTLQNSHPRERFSLTGGGSASIHLWRIFPIPIPLLSISALKHTFDPEIIYQNTFLNTLAPRRLIPFDEVEQVQKNSFVEFNLRNRLFGKRGDEVIRLVEFNLRSRFYPQREDNPEIANREWGVIFGEALFPLGHKLDWKPLGLSIFTKASLDFVGDFYYHPYRGVMTRWNFGLSLREQNRYSLLFSYRFQENLSEVLTVEVGIQCNAKWAVGALFQYDFQQKRLIQQKYTLRRKLHQWYLQFEFQTDEGLKDTRFSLNFAPAFFNSAPQLP